MRVNLGCGQTPTRGWVNFDNSFSVRLARAPRVLVRCLANLRVLGRQQIDFIDFARLHGVEFGDATRGLTLADGAVEVLYTSHMLEHLDRDKASIFLQEAMRLLCKGGVLRIAVPDIRKQVDAYLASGDADAFIDGSRLCVPMPRGFFGKVRAVVVGARHHQWMYDGSSLSKLLEGHGFVDVAVVRPGETRIKNPGELNLHERVAESVYVEATKP